MEEDVVGGYDHNHVVINIREYDAKSDVERVEEMERMCEVGSKGKWRLLTHLLGDPLSRVRNSPTFLMLVAEETCGPEREIVAAIRGCVKTVTCGTMPSSRSAELEHDHDHSHDHTPIYAKVGYLLGLRVSPFHRRRGIGLKLVQRMEEWFRETGAEYAYMATEKDNTPSVQLFTVRCGYAKFRTPSILVHPVHAHRLPLPRRVRILRLPTRDAEALYRRRFSRAEFFPRDIDAVLRNPLSLGTFVAAVRAPESWAVLSVWNCKDVFKLEVRGVARWRRAAARATRVVDRAFPRLRIPSFPDVFRPFGFYFMYGVVGGGPEAPSLVRALSRYVHNMAREGGCGVVVAEVGAREPVRGGIPHWARMSCAEDLWCVKRLWEGVGPKGDWTKAPPGPSIFVDPRDI